MILQIPYQKISGFHSDCLRAFLKFLCQQLHSSFFPYDNAVLQASVNEAAKPENMHYHLNILIKTLVLPCCLYLLSLLSCQETMSLERRLLHVTNNSSTSIRSFPLSACQLYSVDFIEKPTQFSKLCCPLCGLLLACTEMQSTRAYSQALLPHQHQSLFLWAALITTHFKP